ncbi:zinc finger E-box-binding homeobox 2-like [Dunckerocampus dactyliophorus]|uniref:zinc finger E-box-binding homeobox 2-like n=1 Tax=Dunckerocampus dactyliophorus TaxID=161453 RepID=UPI0024066A83|nr:zinc finger E-box-binding homeobox 2-like [Dunckerocampus dactyliophorus]
MEERARFKRRKQANPRRKNVLNDEESGLSRGSRGGGGSEEDETPDASPRVGHALLLDDGSEVSRSWRLGDGTEHFVSGRPADESLCHPATIAEYLERSDTAIIYPEAPEELTPLSTPEGASHDEGEHDLAASDSAGLLTCPFCERGYKRVAPLKEHIRFRHRKGAELFACRLCADTFSERAQLQRHMTAHQPIPEKILNDVAGNRKFKCSECGKAFKYKHHLKEHLRIHSGEKPYECSNCKKRFSHSGSYSSHISSKKCIGLLVLNGRAQNKAGSSPKCSTSSSDSPALAHLRHKLENGQLHQQNRLDKSEVMDMHEYRLLMASQHRFGGSDVYSNSFRENPMSIQSSSHSPLQPLAGLGMDLLLPGTLGSLNDVQKVLQMVDSTMCRQNMDKNPEQVSKLRAYMKEIGAQMEEQIIQQAEDPSSPIKSIIDYTLEMVSEAKSVMDDSRLQLETVMKQQTNQTKELGSKEQSSNSQNRPVPYSCHFCKETFPGPIPLHQHERYLCKMNEEIQAVLQPAQPILSSHQGLESSEWLLAKKEHSTSPINPFKDHVSVLNAYLATNTEPNSDELLKISLAVGLPQESVKDWFSRWKKPPPPPEDNGSDPQHILGHSPMSLPVAELTNTDVFPRQFTAGRTGDRTPDALDHNSPLPLNLSSTPSKHSQSSSYTPNSFVLDEVHGDTPLDLSVPKHLTHALIKQTRPNQFSMEPESEPDVPGKILGPDAKKEVLGSDLHQIEKSASPIFGINAFTAGPVYTSLPAHGAFPPPTFMSPTQATYPVLDSMSFLPQMAYTYASRVATFADTQQTSKKPQKTSFQGVLLDGAVDCLSGLDQLTDSELKMKKTDSGMYACDLCDKTFQKTSSLLRHKYEHTGKRPHQCQICKKAFKHKHHLIEHSRLHSGEKPYQCDKCGKRFSHSGSYSQHMNHRYSYCKREAEERQAAQKEAGDPGSEVLMRRSFLEGPMPLGYSEPEDLQEVGATMLRGSVEGRSGPDGHDGSFGEEEEVQMDSASDSNEDKVQRSLEGYTGEILDQED